VKEGRGVMTQSVSWNGFDNRFFFSGYIILEYEKTFEVLKHFIGQTKRVTNANDVSKWYSGIAFTTDFSTQDTSYWSLRWYF
jgi:hypothetical protein